MHLDQLSIFAWLISVTDRPTDHTTRSVTIGRIYVRSMVIQPNNNNNNGRQSTIADFALGV